MRELQPHMSPDEILEKFKIGNKRFLEGKLLYRDKRPITNGNATLNFI